MQPVCVLLRVMSFKRQEGWESKPNWRSLRQGHRHSSAVMAETWLSPKPLPISSLLLEHGYYRLPLRGHVIKRRLSPEGKHCLFSASCRNLSSCQDIALSRWMLWGKDFLTHIKAYQTWMFPSFSCPWIFPLLLAGVLGPLRNHFEKKNYMLRMAVVWILDNVTGLLIINSRVSTSRLLIKWNNKCHCSFKDIVHHLGLFALVK